MAIDTFTYRSAGLTLTTSVEVSATPTVSRRTGARYIAIETLGVPVTAEGIRTAARLPAMNGKILTLPAGEFRFHDYNNGGTAVDTFKSGLMLNPDIGARMVGISGTVDVATGLPLTSLGMVEMSSHFTSTSYASGTLGTTQSMQATVWCEGPLEYTFQDLNFVGSKQPHPHHGLRVAGGGSTLMENIYLLGASQGRGNMPPEETYSAGVRNPVMKNVHATGMLGGALHSSTLIGVFGDRSDLQNITGADMNAGFLVVYWETAGTHKADLRKLSRPGTGVGGRNGNVFNVEQASGTYDITVGDVLLDGAWPNPLVGGLRKYPNKPAPRHEGKFPHFVVFNTRTRDANGNTVAPYADPNKKPTINVNFVGTYDTVGFVPGGLGYHREYSLATINVRRNGKLLSAVPRPRWYEDVAGFSADNNVWEFSMVPGSSSPWG